jgi:hypothetical protein
LLSSPHSLPQHPPNQESRAGRRQPTSRVAPCARISANAEGIKYADHEVGDLCAYSWVSLRPGDLGRNLAKPCQQRASDEIDRIGFDRLGINQRRQNSAQGPERKAQLYFAPGIRPKALLSDCSRGRYGATIRALYAIDSIGFVLAIIALIGDNGR